MLRFYEKIAYTLSERGVYGVMDDYVEVKENAPGPYFDITNQVEGIQLEMKQWGGSVLGKLMLSDWMFLDVEGGLITKRGRLNFRQKDLHFEDNINVISLTHTRRTPITDRSYAPFIKVKNGIGYSSKKGTGIYFTSSFMAFQSFIATNENYNINFRTSSGYNLVPTTSNSWLYSVTFGVDYLF